MLTLNNLFFKSIKNSNTFRDSLIIFCLIAFFFLWDIKLNIYENFTIALRELFYLFFIYLIFDYKKTYNQKLIKIALFCVFFLFYNLLVIGGSFDQLDIKYNIISIFFLFMIILVCDFYTKEIIKNLSLVSIIFIYILIFSFFFSEPYYLSASQEAINCNIINFQLVNNNKYLYIFLEPSHLAMILVPFYYYIFKLDKIGSLQKIILLFFLLFIFICFYSTTLLFSIIICFFLMMFIDYRFFLKNKLFFLCQLLMILVPIFKSGCVYKINNVISNLPNINKVKNYDVNNFDRSLVLNKDFLKLEEVNYGNIDSKNDELTKIIIETEDNLVMLINEGLKEEERKKYFKYREEISKKIELQAYLYKEKRSFELNHKAAADRDGINYLFKKKKDLLTIKQNSNDKFFKDNTNKFNNLTKIIIETEDNLVMLINEGLKEEDRKKYFKYREKIFELMELKKHLYKKKILFKNKNKSAKEINYLIRENLDLLPLKNLGKNASDPNLSSAVLINAVTVAYYAIKEKPLGWGFNNYQTAFNKFMLKTITPTIDDIYFLNYNDGSNNSVKLIVEFGIFSLIIFINLLYFIFNKKIPTSQRVLFAGIILIQMMRAAGYFNGGFVLCVVFTFILNYKSFKKNEQ